MTDIELVIKLPEEVYEMIMLKINTSVVAKSCSEAEKIIAKGTPLPKGHGRLIDVGQCDRKLFYQQCGGSDSLITVKSAFDMLMLLPTIIEADKEDSED